MSWRAAAHWLRQQVLHFPQSLFWNEDEHHVQASGSQLERFEARISTVFKAMVLLSSKPSAQMHIPLLEAKLVTTSTKLVMNGAHENATWTI